MSVITADAPAGCAPARAWRALAILFALYLLSQVDRQAVSLLVKPIKADLRLTDLEMSVILGPAFALFYAAFGLPLGWAADRYPRRRVICLGAAIWGVATVAGGFAQSFPELFAARMVVGIGEAALLPCAYSLIADTFPRGQLMLANAVFQSAGTIGLAVAVTVGGLATGLARQMAGEAWPLVGVLRDWQIVMFLVGAPALVFALLALTIAEPRHAVARHVAPRKADRRADVDLWPFFLSRRRILVPMLLGFGSLSLSGYTMVAWGPAYIERHFGLTPAQFGPALGIANLGVALSVVLIGRIVDRRAARGRRNVHLAFYSNILLAAVPFVIAAFSVERPAFYFMLYTPIVAATAPSLVFASSVLAIIAPAALRGRLVALFLFVYTVVGLGIGPVAVGMITDHVLHDERRIGVAMEIVVALALLSGGVALKFASRALEVPDRT